MSMATSPAPMPSTSRTRSRPVDGSPHQPHPTSLVVWDLPPTIERGETFRVMLGVKCSLGCRPEGWTVEVRDQDGERRASEEVGGEPWPGTKGLYYTEMELTAPEIEGLYAWECAACVTEGDGGEEGRHRGCVAPIRVRVVPAPDLLLRVVALDGETRSPVEGAKAFVHPYEAFTDERGEAALRLPTGPFRLFVSGRGHAPLRIDGDLAEDRTIRAELALDRELSDADIWF